MVSVFLAIYFQVVQAQRSSRLQDSSAAGGKSERFSFAQGAQSVGQKLYSLTREALQQLLALAQKLFTQGRSAEHILEVLMPA